MVFLFFLPFLVTVFERLLRTTFLPIFVYAVTCIGLLIFSLLSKTDYGWNFNATNKKIIALLLGLLALVSIFLFSILKLKNLFVTQWGLNWIVWIFLVFREEFILRGIIQTTASKLLVGKWLGLSKSIWFTSLIFSLWHLVNLGTFTVQVVIIQIVSVFLIAGPLYGWLKEKTNNVIITYLCHISGDFFFYAIYTLIFSKLLFPLWN